MYFHPFGRFKSDLHPRATEFASVHLPDPDYYDEVNMISDRIYKSLDLLRKFEPGLGRAYDIEVDFNGVRVFWVKKIEK